MEQITYFLFYGSLNDFLLKKQRQASIRYSFQSASTVKDVVEALGVPHPEIGRIVMQEREVGFAELIQANAQVEVFPVEPEDGTRPLPPLQVPAAVPARFVLDVHLGKLARYLRLLGFDTLYETHYSDKTIADLSAAEQRIALTRDIGLLKQKQVQTGYWLRSQHLEEQVREVMNRFGLKRQLQPFTRCMACNGTIEEVAKENVLAQLPPKTKQYFEVFYQCTSCHKVYWKGSHYEKMQVFLQSLRAKLPRG